MFGNLKCGLFWDILLFFPLLAVSFLSEVLLYSRVSALCTFSSFLSEKGIDVLVEPQYDGHNVTEDHQNILDHHLVLVGLVRDTPTIVVSQWTLPIEIYWCVQMYTYSLCFCIS